MRTSRSLRVLLQSRQRAPQPDSRRVLQRCMLQSVPRVKFQVGGDMKPYHIEDWAGNRMASGLTFDSFHSAWEWVYLNVAESEWDDVFVECESEEEP